ncbi:hypothetical protein ACMD2_17387 [Ananas comosus]|uniref:Uncharacterized protein n=1 Tax=Ananas comosus TaxID=4615 RepID=A0A199VR35_ANACO|nr:hypothetical protein ACMD2_17387 [Ananas comosus]
MRWDSISCEEGERTLNCSSTTIRRIESNAKGFCTLEYEIRSGWVEPVAGRLRFSLEKWMKRVRISLLGLSPKRPASLYAEVHGSREGHEYRSILHTSYVAHGQLHKRFTALPFPLNLTIHNEPADRASSQGREGNSPPLSLLIKTSETRTPASWLSGRRLKRRQTESRGPDSRQASSRPQGCQLSDEPIGSGRTISQAPGLDRTTRSQPIEGTNGVAMNAAATAEPERS